MYDILFETTPWHTRAALFREDGKLIALAVDDINRPLRDGTIVYGRVRKVVSGLNAAFVDIGDAHDGFLRLNTIPKDMPKPTEGMPIVVRIARAADLAKGARLDARVAMDPPTDTSIQPPYVMRRSPKALQRCLHDAGDTPVRCWVNTREDVPAVAERIPEPNIFVLAEHENVFLHEQMEDEIHQLESGMFPLHTPYGKGALAVEVTKALTAIDVDAGDLTGNRKEAVKALNLAAAAEVARLCKLLDLGGNVMVDFVSMSSMHHRQQVTHALRDAFAQTDLAKVEVMAMSRFCMVEVNRERHGAMLPELLSYPAMVSGEVLLKLFRTPQLWLAQRGVMVEAHPLVISFLQNRLPQQEALAKLGVPLQLVPRQDWPETRTHIS